MKLWDKVKSWFKKTFSGGSSTKKTTTTRSSSNSNSYSRKDGGNGYYNSSRSTSANDEAKRQREEQAKKRKEEAERKRNRERLDKFKAKEVDYKSMSNAVSKASDGVTKAITSSPKIKSLSAKQKLDKQKEFKANIRNSVKYATSDDFTVDERGKKAINRERLKKETEKQKYKLTDKDYKTVTKKVANVDETGNWDGTYKTVKMKALTDKGYEKKLKGDKGYRLWESAGRGVLKPLTIGGSEVLFKKTLDKDTEETYQKNKSKLAEGGASLAGSLLTFGAVGKDATKLAERMAGTKGGKKLTAKLAEKKLIQASAKKAVDKAVKKGLIKEGSEELVKKTAQEKASKLVKALGQDAIINATAGAGMDISEATANHKVGTKDWWKTLGKNAALNWGIGGAVTLPTSGAFGKKAALEAYENIVKTNVAKNALEARFGKIELPTISAKKSVKNATGVDISKPMSDTDIGTLKTMRDNLADSLRREPQGSEQAKSLTQKLKNIDRVLKRVDGVEGAARNSDEALEGITRSVDDLQANPIRVESKGVANQTKQMTLEEALGRGSAEPRAPKVETNDFPYAMAKEGAEGINPDTPLDSLRARAKDIADGDEIRATGASKSATSGAEGISEGQRLAQEEYYKKTGTRIERGKRATDEQILDALGKYEKSQGESAERKLSRFAYSQIKVSDTDTAKVIDNLVNKGSFTYSTVNQKKMYEEVAKDLNENSQLWIDKLGSIAEGGDWSGREQTKLLYMTQYLSEITDATKSPEQEALATMTWKASQKLLTSSAQTMNGRSLYARLSRAGKMESALDDLAEMLGSSLGFKHKHRKALSGLSKFEREHYIKGQLLQDDAIRKQLSNLADAKTNDEISEAYTELLYKFNKHHTKSAFDVIQELRYLNMLGNPKTHIRNVFGSAFFSPMRQASNTIRSAIEEGVAEWASKQAGETLEITRHGGFSLTAAKEAWVKNPTTEAGKSALEAFERLKPDVLGSVKYDTPMYKGRARTLTGKVFDALADFNSTLLTKEDDFFRSRAFRENYIKSYNRYLNDGKPITEKIKRQIEAEAIRESQIATFNEYNDFAQWLTKVTSNATNANASIGARWTARGVNAIMPFAKVPANLAKQSINYSPLGIARGMAGIKKAAQTGDSALLNEAIDQFASGITGTGVFGLGMLLGKTTDMFTTNAGKNDPAAKFKKGQGMQNYSINFVDPETGKGHSYTLDWLVPTSATFFSGVELANQLKSGDFNVLDIGGSWATVMSRLAEPVMETSMLSGLHGMLETMRSGYNGDDELGAIHILGRETIQSYLNSLIPTLVGQVARTAYKSDMQITGSDDWEYWRNSIKSKAGLANTKILGEELGADTDLFGNVKNEKHSAKDYVVSGLKNLLSPSNIQQIDLSDVDRAKLAEYEERVKNGEDPSELAYLFPKKQYKKKYTVGDEEVNLTNRELSLYNQAKTTGGGEGMRYVLESIIFNRYGKDESGKRTVLLDGYTPEEKAELIDKAQNWSMRDVEKWLYDNPRFQNASDAEQKKVIRDLWNLNKQGKAVASQRVGERAVYEAQGKDVNEYDFKNEVTDKKREALQSYIDSGLISYEEAVDFARYAGKTYYYEDEDGGTSKTYYNKGAMIDYLTEKGYSYEKAEALYNAFKASNAKAFSGLGKSGKGGRGYRRYRRRGRKASTKTLKPKAIKTSNFKAGKGVKTSSMASGSGGSGSRSSSKSTAIKSAKVSKSETIKTKPTVKTKGDVTRLDTPRKTTSTAKTQTKRTQTAGVKSAPVTAQRLKAGALKTSATSKKKTKSKSYLKTTKITPPKAKMKKYEV